jgi:uncharacterized protein YggU (UPF0235/DUF167 family)
MKPARLVPIHVKPNARVSLLEETAPGVWSAQLKSPTVDGRANAELIRLVARHWGCRRADVSIRGGASGRVKWVRIEAGDTSG